VDDIIVLVPSRGRPQNAVRLVEAWEKTDTMNAVLMFITDDDDPELEAYRTLLTEGVIKHMITLPAPPVPGITIPLNRAVTIFQDAFKVIGFMGDDHAPRTTGWEDRVLEAADTCCPRVVYTNDLFQGENLPTAVFMPSRMIKAMGFMSPPVLAHLYADNFWKTVGTDLGGLRYLSDVVIEHMHPAAGKAAMDERYRIVNAPAIDAGDRGAYGGFIAGPAYTDTLRRVREEYGIQ
jgi:hypothetical protein